MSGMELTGLQRANSLCSGEKISEETIARMAAFERHRKNSVIAPEFEGTEPAYMESSTGEPSKMSHAPSVVL